MERYTRFSILGFVFPSFLVFFGTRHGAFVLLHGIFYTLTMRGLNITKYSIQKIGLTFYDPLVLLDPAISLFTNLRSYGNPITVNLDSTIILMTSNAGWYFYNSALIIIAGFAIHFYLKRKYTDDSSTYIDEKPLMNPYSQITLIVTLFFVFFFQITSYILLPLENENFEESFLVPIGSLFILFAIVSILNNLEDNYLFVMKYLAYILLAIVGVALLFAWIGINTNDNFFYKVAFVGLLFVAQYIIYKNILFLDKLKTENQQISGSLVKQLFQPILVNKNIPYFESTLALLTLTGYRVFNQLTELNTLQPGFLIFILYSIAFASILIRHNYGPLVAVVAFGLDLLLTISSVGILSNDVIIVGILINVIALYSCYKEYFAIQNYSSKQDTIIIDNLARGYFRQVMQSSWVKYIAFILVFFTFDTLYINSMNEAILINISFLIIIAILLSLININKYSFEAKLQSIYVLIVIITMFFILDLLYQLVASTITFPVIG